MAEIVTSVILDRLLRALSSELTDGFKHVTEIHNAVEHLKGNLKTIMVVLGDAEGKQSNTNVKDWLEKLKDVSYDIDDVLDEWNTRIVMMEIRDNNNNQTTNVPNLNKLLFYMCFQCDTHHDRPPRNVISQLKLHYKFSKKIEELNGRVDAICIEKDKFSFNMSNSTASCSQQVGERRLMTTSFIDVSEVYGRDLEEEVLVDKLVGDHEGGIGRRDDKNNMTNNTLHIVGMGGIGKTTLAKLAYHAKKVKQHFDLRMWICVSEPFDEMKIMKEILEFLKVYDAQNITQLEILTKLIADALSGKVFLLVLDDVWTTSYQKWEHIKWCLESGDPRSRILITTRKEEVVQMMGAEERMIRLEVLTKEVCWSIFSKIAFFNREQNSQLERIGRELVHKCQGLPLAAKTLGSLMRLKRHVHQWNYILNSALWNIEDLQVNVFVPFMLSYHDLPPLEKVCLLYCCVFPKDHVIDRDELITMWLSQDLFSPSKNLEQQDLSCIEQCFELQAKDCFENLAARSFFQDFKKDNDGRIEKCKMHDLIHDFLQYLTAKEYFMVDTYNNNQGREGTVSTTVNQANEKARHATLLLESDSQIPESVNMKRHLRTLFITSSDGSTFLRLNLENLKLVRTLHLSGARIAEIPKEIKELIHLRYLCISDNYHLKELPEQVCDLYNLMTLRIYRCPEFQTWPKQMLKLKNLRYLYVKGCDKIKAPPGLAIWDVKIFH